MTRPHEQLSFGPRTRPLRTRAIALGFALLCAAQAVVGAPIKSYATLKLKDGRTFSAVQVVNYTTNGVLVRHAGGATTFRIDVLPDDVLVDLHLQGWQKDPALVSLADKPAVAEGADVSLADRPAVADAVATENHASANTPAMASMPITSATADAAIADLPARAPEATAQPATPPPAGEGNMPEFFSTSPTVVIGATSDRVTTAGRVMVKGPGGATFFLDGVEVRAYPAGLLAGYVTEAKARAQQAEQQLREQAAIAAREARVADFDVLTARANRDARRLAGYLPNAPVTTHSDQFGNFTLQHALPEVRLVATGHLKTARGEWTYEWIGLAPQGDATLTEANATVVIPPDTNAQKYATR